MVASNTKDCFRECIGKTIRGFLFDALPAFRPDLAKGNKTLIFEDGTGLTISNTGAYWLDSAFDISRALAERKLQLDRNSQDIRDALLAAGVEG